MRKLLLGVVGALAAATPAIGQTVPLPVQLQSFSIKAFIDWPQTMDMIPRNRPLGIMGWTFECLSGLQPSSQRVGDIAVSFKHYDATTVTEYTPRPGSVHLFNGMRPDVAAAFRYECPAVGSHVGFGLVVDDLPPTGLWRIELIVDTYDGAGRIAAQLIKRTIIVTDR